MGMARRRRVPEQGAGMAQRTMDVATEGEAFGNTSFLLNAKKQIFVTWIRFVFLAQKFFEQVAA